MEIKIARPGEARGREGIMAGSNFSLQMRNYEGDVIKNVATTLEFRKDDQRVDDPITRLFANGREFFSIPPFPQGRWDCRVSASRYETRNSGFFRPKANKRTNREIWLPRNVDTDWATRFVPWNKLTGKFAKLKTLLQRSPNVTLKIRDDGSLTPLGKYTAAKYNNHDDPQLRLAKTGMLNMYAKLIATTVPGTSGSPWFSGITELLAIQRDRIVGAASPAMANKVLSIRENIKAFPGYMRVSSGQHYEKNIEPLIPTDYSRKKVYSIKTREKIGVLQLVIAETRTPQGETKFFVDADIDENGKLLAHFADFIKHQFNGGTHPIHVHDILHRTLKSPVLGYKLT